MSHDFETKPPVKSPSSDANTWATILHVSQFAGYLIPFAGFVAPILIWQLKKEGMPALDAHGKIVANWMLSAVIYAVVSFVLTFVLVGFLLGFILAIALIVFPIIGAIKAAKGEAWPYPLSIRFFS